MNREDLLWAWVSGVLWGAACVGVLWLIAHLW